MSVGLDELYKLHGYYEGRLLSYTFEGSSGFAHMQDMMKGLRVNAPADIAGFKVCKVGDYQLSVMKDEQGETVIDLPKSNVIRFFLEKGCEAVVRPSGTEPKLKIYLTTAGATPEECRDNAEKLEAYFAAWANG